VRGPTASRCDNRVRPAVARLVCVCGCLVAAGRSPLVSHAHALRIHHMSGSALRATHRAGLDYGYVITPLLHASATPGRETKPRTAQMSIHDSESGLRETA
jgi:hypothetical protein